jgi:hypothetical protein
MVVALIALFVSLGGVSFGAALVISGKQIKNNTVGTKDLKNNDIRGKDVRNNSLTGSDVNESKLGKVPNAAHADSADNAKEVGGKTPAQLGGVTAYARVNGAAPTGGDTVDDALSKGITDAMVVHPQTGVYCFINLGFTPKNIVANIDVNDSPGGPTGIDTIYTHLSGFTTCTGFQTTAQAGVRTRNQGSVANRSFFVVFQ